MLCDVVIVPAVISCLGPCVPGLLGLPPAYSAAQPSRPSQSAGLAPVRRSGFARAVCVTRVVPPRHAACPLLPPLRLPVHAVCLCLCSCPADRSICTSLQIAHICVDLDYRDIERFALETNRDHSVVFETASKYCSLDSFKSV